MDFTPLLPAQRLIADAASNAIKQRYGLGNPRVNEPIASNLSWRPSLLWKCREEYVACEIADRPLPTSIKVLFSDISATGLPIRIVVAYASPTALSTTDYERDVSDARKLGIGYLPVVNGTPATVEHNGIPISLYLPPPERKKYKRCIQKPIQDAYDLYINGDPKHGVQEVGQTVEAVMVQLATQAKAKGKLTTGGFVPGTYYRFAQLVDDLMADKIIQRGILAKCRGFVDDRNCTSHKAKSIKDAAKNAAKMRGCFTLGLQLLEDLPSTFAEEGYVFRC